MRLPIALILVLSLVTTASAETTGSRFKPAVSGANGVVATEHPLASRAATDTLARGGNAVDAAAAAVFAIGVVRPEMCGVGGGGFLVHRSAGGRVRTLDFRETAPADYRFSTGLTFPGTTPIGDPYFGTGHNVAGVPGVVAGLAAAVDRLGRRSLAAAIAPAQRLARDGFPVTGATVEFSKQSLHRLRLYDAAARIYLKDGLQPYAAGDLLVQADYARTLAAIAQDGPDAFYRGAVADAIVASMGASGLIPGDRGTMTRQDLERYRPIWRSAIRTRYRGHTVLGMPAPSSGGLAMAEMLNLLAGFDLRRAGHGSTEHLHLLAEAQKIAWADRNAYVADPAFADVPQRLLAGRAYADVRRPEIDPLRAKTYGPASRPEAPGHTTHVSVIDRRGAAVAVTCTIEQPFGSAVVAPGTGFLLNNQLTDFDAPGTANAPAPGKRPRSSMSPTIVVRGKQPVLVAGGAGGPSIIMGAVHSVLNTVDFGLDPAYAVDAARSDARGVCAGGGLQLCLEETRVAPGTLDGLKARGHVLTNMGEYAAFPLVQVAGTDRRTGRRMAASDPRNAPSRSQEYDGAAAEPGRR